MSRYVAVRSDVLPARIGNRLARTLKSMDQQTMALERADEVKIGRTVQAARKGMLGIALIAADEAAWAQAQPHAADRVRGAAELASVAIYARIAETGY